MKNIHQLHFILIEVNKKWIESIENITGNMRKYRSKITYDYRLIIFVKNRLTSAQFKMK
jgi:hypothetical protein